MEPGQVCHGPSWITLALAWAFSPWRQMKVKLPAWGRLRPSSVLQRLVKSRLSGAQDCVGLSPGRLGLSSHGRCPFSSALVPLPPQFHSLSSGCRGAPLRRACWLLLSLLQVGKPICSRRPQDRVEASSWEWRRRLLGWGSEYQPGLSKTVFGGLPSLQALQEEGSVKGQQGLPISTSSLALFGPSLPASPSDALIFHLVR